VREAKQAFRAEAVPMREETKRILRVVRRSGGRRDSWGPERGMDGRFQVEVWSLAVVVEVLDAAELSLALSLFFSWDGGEPMMPPSRNLIVMGGGGGVSKPESGPSCWPASESVLVRRRARDGVGGGDTTSGTALKSTKIFATVLGEMALRSIKITSFDSVPFLSFLAWPAVLQASATLLAVARASRGGTMLRMISACATSSSSEPRSVIFAARIRSLVC